ALFKQLQALLNGKHIRRQYAKEEPSISSKFPLSPRSQKGVPAAAMVTFKLVFWRCQTTPTKRKSATKEVVACNDSWLPMCGSYRSLIRYKERTSTLGLLIRAGSKLYGLTVDHVFDNIVNQGQSSFKGPPPILASQSDADNKSEGDQTELAWINNMIYAELDMEEPVSEIESKTSSQSEHGGSMVSNLDTDHAASIRGHKVNTQPIVHSSQAYLDWALIEFDGGYFERPNAICLEDDEDLKFHGGLSTTPKMELMPVLMIFGVSGIRKGVILASNAYIGNKHGASLCQAWNVILSDSVSESTILWILLQFTKRT
ncbi:hypothetical protein B0J14DRAFT_492604, partial [Halenospora varia]